MNIQEMTGRIEAVIFACGDPISITRLAQVMEVKVDFIENVIENLQRKHNSSSSGVHLVLLDGNVQFCTNSSYGDSVKAALDLRRNTPLSQAALEVLAVIAYNQPVTKSFVEQIRGVDCSGVIGSLVQKGLLEEHGRLELPGRPLLYGTTDNFLRCMGIENISQLPEPPRGADDTADEDEQETGDAVKTAVGDQIVF